MESSSDNEDIEGEVEPNETAAEWGKAKHDYYYTDYVDKDYPSKLTAKEERLASIEQEEALRIQKKLLSTLEDVDLGIVFDEEESGQENLIDIIERKNTTINTLFESKKNDKSKKRKRVAFDDQRESDDNDEEEDDEDNQGQEDEEKEGRRRRPINIAIQKNRGLTPYKKKEYRNPRVKHKLKYKKAMSKRRRNIGVAQSEFYRYSGETSGIKTSTIKSVKLC